MLLTRRGFVASSAAALAVGALTGLSNPQDAQAKPQGVKRDYNWLEGAKETITICPYCACGCSTICRTVNGEVVEMEGDPDQPSTRGSLCPKGASQFQTRNVYDPKTGKQMHNPARMTKCLYRAPHATEWEEKSLEWMMQTIAERTIKLRNQTYEHTDKDGHIVNRCEGIGWLGFAGADNEEAQVIAKLARSMGLTYFDHQARI